MAVRMKYIEFKGNRAPFEDALCAGLDPNAWHSDDAEITRIAKRICSRCKAKPDCLRMVNELEGDVGIANRHGIWAGLDPAERTALKERDVDIPGEEWAICHEWPEYEASDLGRIRRRKTGRIIKEHDGPNRAKLLSVSSGGKAKTVLVHQLVASAWIPGFSWGTVVKHLDGNNSNNVLSNLSPLDTPAKRSAKHPA